MSNTENCLTAAKPFLIMGKVLGLFPVNFATRKIHKCDILITFCSMLGLVFISLSCLIHKNFFITNSKLLSAAWIISFNFEVLSFFCLFCYQIYKRKNIQKFLSLINVIDKEVDNFSI